MRCSFLHCSKFSLRDLLNGAPAAADRWLSLLSNYNECRNQALHVQRETISSIFKACAVLRSLKLGKSIHSDVIKQGFDVYTSVSNSVMNFYIKCGMIHSASIVFDGIMIKDSVSWNTMINGLLCEDFIDCGFNFFVKARVFGFEPNVSTLVLIIQSCWKMEDMDEGMHIHGLSIRNGFYSDVSVQNSLLSMYSKLQDTESAQQLFDEMSERDVISWSSLIGGVSQSGHPLKALQLFHDMTEERNIEIDGLALVSSLQACSNLGDIRQGRIIHGYLIRKGFENSLFVSNSIIDMYSKCHDIDSAYAAFNQMAAKTIISWNSLLSGLVQIERYKESFLLFDLMKKSGIEADEVTLVILLQICKKLEEPIWCKCIHSVIIRNTFDSNCFVLNSLLDAYLKCGLVDPAINLFEQIGSRRNLVSWSTMISGYSYCGKPDKAISFFSHMQMAQIKPNVVTILSLLEACSLSAELKPSKSAHAVSVKYDFTRTLTIGTALIDMYAKCGDVSSSEKVFVKMTEKNILSWNAMIGALGMNGRARESLALFHDMMETENIKPNGITILLILSACSHGGLVEEGISIFERIIMSDHQVPPTLAHYSCMVDMLSRGGHVDAAFELIIRMQKEGLKPGPAAWGALLSACRSHGNYELRHKAAANVLELEPYNSGGYILVSNLYGIARTRRLMRERGVTVAGGYSLVSVGQKTHKFVAWDVSHGESKEIYAMVEMMHLVMKWKIKNDYPVI